MTSNEDERKPLSSRKKRLFAIIAVVWSTTIGLLIAEYAVRQFGAVPLDIKRANIHVEPGGTYFRKHTNLGYTHLPGKFVVTLYGKHQFTTTHNEKTLRITHPIDQDSLYRDKDKIWIFGCSYTHGWSLNDHETYPWILQQLLRDQFEVVNWGVSGYGTIHSMLQLEAALKEESVPKYVILSYAAFHDGRNTFTSSRRKSVASWNYLGPLMQPYSRLGDEGELKILKADNVVYDEWPLVRSSALMNFLQNKYNQFDDQKTNHYAVSEALIKRMHDMCEEHDVTLIVAEITKHPEEPDRVSDFCAANNILYVDNAVDLDIPGMKNYPLSGHPSVQATRQYAYNLWTNLVELRTDANVFLSTPTLGQASPTGAAN